MTVDLSTLQVGEVVELRDGSRHVVTNSFPNMGDYFQVVTETYRAGYEAEHGSLRWNHGRDGGWLDMARPRLDLPGSIVAVLPAGTLARPPRAAAVDVLSLRAGDVIELRDGTCHVVTGVGTPASDARRRVYTSAGRVGRDELMSVGWWHSRDGIWLDGEEVPGDIVAMYLQPRESAPGEPGTDADTPVPTPVTSTPSPTLSSADKLAALAALSPEEFRQRCTFGFELETQSSDGVGPEDGEFDEEAFEEAVEGRADDCLSFRVSRLPEEVREALMDTLREHFREELNQDDYTKSGRSPEDFEHEHRDKLAGVEVVTDGSVDGYEFRTEGGCTLADLERRARGVFAIEHEIDTGCSFHVHVKVQHVRHLYSVEAFREVVAYLLSRYEEMPESLKRRLADSGARDRFFNFDVNPDKYRAVNWHRQGTVEFRLFGNIRNADDGVKCAMLAADAMRHLYRVSAGLEAPLDNAAVGDHEFTTRCGQACDERRPLNLRKLAHTGICLDVAA